ncbi:MAG: hypothetical protein U0822_14745 [Anaerolineae bacterium]
MPETTIPFVPFVTPAPRPGVLRRWSAPLPAAWVSAVIEATTRPGDLVVDPFCQGDAVVRAALRLGRSVAATDFNPVQTLAARAAAAPPATQTLGRATLRLSEVAKVDRPLHEHIQSLYLTRCPECRADTPAESFTWDNAAGVPTRKTLTCVHCGWRGSHIADADDIARATELEPLSLSYWHLVERLADPAEALRPLAERIVGLYTPRAQRALADLLRHLEHLDLSPDESEALRMVLLGCLDACSSLNAAPWDSAAPRRLEPPRRYVELNVWHAFETIAASLRDEPLAPDAEWVAEPRLIQTGAALPYVFLGRLQARPLAESLAGRGALIVGAPPRTSSVFWTLSWAWASWLWSRRAAAGLRPLADTAVSLDWYTGALGATLAGLRAALRADGRLALRWAGDHTILSTVHVAAAGAGYRLSDAVFRLPRLGARWLEAQVVCEKLPQRPARSGAEQAGALGKTVQEAAAALAPGLIVERGEPLGIESIMPAAFAAVHHSGALAEAVGIWGDTSQAAEFIRGRVFDALADDDTGLTRLPDGRYWTDAASETAPLSERVEETVIRGLARTRNPDEDSRALPVAEVYAALPGVVAPDNEMVRLSLETHAHEVAPGMWAAHASAEPLRHAVGDLVTLGEALGYTVQFPMPWSVDERTALAPAEIVWFAGGRPATRFLLQDGALLAAHLSPPYAVPHLLVIPAAAARLAALKLDRAPHLQARLDSAGWEIIVAERLHRWLGTSPDPEAWREIVGLQETPTDGQLRLFT